MLSVLFFLLCYSTSICLFLGGVENPSRPTDLEFPVFLTLAIAEVALIIGYIFFENRVFKLKINIPLIIILSCLFIVNLMVIVTTPLENTFNYVYNDIPNSTLITITNEYKVMYIICFILLLLNIYISFNYMIFRLQFKRHFIWICLLGLLIGSFTLIYSYITEWETYKLFIENIATTVRTYNPKSLTNNTNNFAAILLGTGFCCYGLFAATKKHVFWIIGLFFCMNTIFPMSRICFILSIGLSLAIFFYQMIMTWKGHQIRNINLSLIVVIIIVLFFIMRYNIPEMRDYIEHVLLTNNSSINSRKPLWDLSISLTQDFHRFIGLGHGYFNTVFSIINNESIKMPHNLYVQTYASLGFVGLALFAALITFALYKIVILYKNNREAALISIIGLATVLVFYLVEG